MTTLALIGGFLLLMAIGVPVAVSLAGASLIYVIVEGVQPHLVVLHRMVGGTDSFPLLAIPFFIMAGSLMNSGGITTRIYEFALALVGRLGAKFVRKNGQMLVGFREKHAPYLAELTRCEVLHPNVGERITELAELIGGMEARERIPQIEVAVGDDATALVFRNLDALSDADTIRLRAYAERTGLHIYLQPAGPDSVTLLWPEQSSLTYRLPAYDVQLTSLPTDFTQVNREINGAMIELALELMDLQVNDRVLDLFCGLGNFMLP